MNGASLHAKREKKGGVGGGALLADYMYFHLILVLHDKVEREAEYQRDGATNYLDANALSRSSFLSWST